MKLYTRHGDTGQTTLVGGKRVMKDDIRIAVCGDLDELNAHIGMLRSFGVPERELNVLIRVQQQLFHIGGELSNPDFAMQSHLTAADIAQLEQCVDTLQKETPGQKPLSCLVDAPQPPSRMCVAPWHVVQSAAL